MSIGNAALVIWQDEKPVVVSRAFFDEEKAKRENELWERDAQYRDFIFQNRITLYVNLELYDKVNFYRFYPQLTASDAPTIAIFYPDMEEVFKCKGNVLKMWARASGGICVIIDPKTAYKFEELSTTDRIEVAKQIRDLGGLNGT